MFLKLIQLSEEFKILIIIQVICPKSWTASILVNISMPNLGPSEDYCKTMEKFKNFSGTNALAYCSNKYSWRYQGRVLQRFLILNRSKLRYDSITAFMSLYKDIL